MSEPEREVKQKKADQITFIFLFAFNVLMACIPLDKLTEYIANFSGSCTVPFLQFVLPGYLYLNYLSIYGNENEYYNLKKPRDRIKRFIFGKTFATIFILVGLAQIFCFTTAIIYGFFVI
jgi:hypothetical protein